MSVMPRARHESRQPQAWLIYNVSRKKIMTRSDRALLQKVECLLKSGKQVFVGDPSFKNHRNFPAGAILISDDRLTGRLKEDGYITFDDTVWRHDEVSGTHKRSIPGLVVKRVTEQWSKEKRDYDRHLVAILALAIGILGAALTIFRDF